MDVGFRVEALGIRVGDKSLGPRGCQEGLYRLNEANGYENGNVMETGA